LDGHIVLSRELAQRGHYPAIDVLASVSRLMTEVATDEHRKAALDVRHLMAIYKNAEDLIQIGAYSAGSNAQTDRAIHYRDAINQFLIQRPDEPSVWETTGAALQGIIK
jgi:flagellum-specific ATP synthase